MHKDTASPGLRQGNPARVSAVLQELVPPGVVTVELAGDADPALLLRSERRCVAAAAPQRQRAFTAGRLCARRALEHFGFDNFPLEVARDRLPAWPANLTGSITHSDGFAAAAVAERARFRGIGLCARRIAAGADVADPDGAWLASLPESQRPAVATLAACARDAFWKGLYAATREPRGSDDDYLLSFTGVEVGGGVFALDPAKAGAWSAALLAPLTLGRFRIVGNLAVAAVAIAAR